MKNISEINESCIGDLGEFSRNSETGAVALVRASEGKDLEMEEGWK